MGILAKIRLGVQHELHLYRYHPILLLQENYAILAGLLFSICIAIWHSFVTSIIANASELVVITSLICLLLSLSNYFSPGITVVMKIHGDKEVKVRRFMIVITILFLPRPKICSRHMECLMLLIRLTSY